MELRITLLLVGLVCLAAWTQAKPAGDDYEYEDHPAPAPKRNNLLLNRRNPLSRNNAKTTTTTTPEPVQEEEEAPADEEEEVEEEVPVEPSSTTEPPRKLKGGILRPFRSNDDLLAALKRRREQAAAAKPNKVQQVEADSEPQQEVTPKPTKAPASAGGRRRFNSGSKQDNAESEPAGSNAPARTGRRFNGRS